jgi:hypothetical protein
LLAATLFPDPLSNELVEPILPNTMGAYDGIATGALIEADVAFDTVGAGVTTAVVAGTFVVAYDTVGADVTAAVVSGAVVVVYNTVGAVVVAAS